MEWRCLMTSSTDSLYFEVPLFDWVGSGGCGRARDTLFECRPAVHDGGSGGRLRRSGGGGRPIGDRDVVLPQGSLRSVSVILFDPFSAYLSSAIPPPPVDDSAGSTPVDGPAMSAPPWGSARVPVGGALLLSPHACWTRTGVMTVTGQLRFPLPPGTLLRHPEIGDDTAIIVGWGGAPTDQPSNPGVHALLQIQT